MDIKTPRSGHVSHDNPYLLTTDEIVIRMLEGLKNKFKEDRDYPGRHIRLEIDLLIKRMM